MPDGMTPPPPPPGGRFASTPLGRNILAGVVVVSLAAAGTAATYLLVKHNGGFAGKSAAAPSGEMQKMQNDYAELKKKYEDLEIDRNNVLSQTKNLLQEKAKWDEMGSQLENLKKTNRVFMEQKEKLLNDNVRLKTEIAEFLQSFESLKESYQELLTKQEAAEKENADLRRLLTTQVENTPQFQTLDREAKRLREENLNLGETINLLEERIKKALDRIKQDQGREVSMVRQIHEQKASLDQLRSQNGSLAQGNKDLNLMISQTPERVKDIAAQNQQLLKEIAEMHYNMGVFFTDNKQYPQAEKEYLRALDFDPNNLKVHYNLGYLYAEDLDKQDKAVKHLEKFLQLDPDAKESEAIRAYIAERHVWNGTGATGRKK